MSKVSQKEGNMRTPVTYYGGKQTLASKLVRLIPKHTTYVEPFCGGASLMFKKPYPKTTSTVQYREVINDADERLINFYRMLQDNHDELITKIQLTPYSESENKRAINILKNPEGVSNLDRAWAYYVNTQQGLFSVLYNVWAKSIVGSNMGMRWANKIKGLPEYIDRMAGVHVACKDGVTCIKQWDSASTFFFVDPPYPGTDMAHYKGYTQEEFKELIYTLSNIQGSFILTCYNNPAIPEEWERHEFTVSCAPKQKGKYLSSRSDFSKMKNTKGLETNFSINGEDKRKEFAWRKVNRQVTRAEVVKVYNSDILDCFVG